MLVTEFGMVTEVKPVQPWKALLPMLVTEFGMVTEVKPVQPWKALLPMLVTEFGMVTEVSPVILRHINAGITRTLLPKVKLVILGQE